MVYDLRPRGYGGYRTFDRGRSPSPGAARRVSSSSAPASLVALPVPRSAGVVGILPCRRGRGQIALLIAGVAVFAPAAVAAFMFTALGVCLLGSSTAVVDMQIMFVWPPASAAGFISAVVLAACLVLWLV